MQAAAVARATIPTPSEDPASLAECCIALKQAVEQIMGRYGEADFGRAARITVSGEMPKIIGDGDFWLSEGATNTLSMSYQGKWLRLGVLTP